LARQFSGNRYPLSNLPDIVTDGLLDRRTESEFYNQSWELAKRYFPEWTSSYPAGYVPDFNALSIADPGLVTLRLFADLSRYLTRQLNRTPTNQNLSFYDFLGLRQLLPEPALAPLVYTLAPNGLAVSIEQGRQITTTYDPLILFEMLRPVKVMPVVLSDILFQDPGEDTCTDYGSQFLNAGLSKRLPHQLYLGDAELFDFMSATTKLKIRFSGANLYPKWFAKWTLYKDGCAFPVDPKGNYDQLTAVLSVKEDPGAVAPAVPDELVAQYPDDSWVRIEPGRSVRVLENMAALLPEITRVEAVLVEETGVLPTFSAFNDSPLDIKKGVQPFGATPVTNDTFYLGSYVFGMKNAQVQLHVEVTPIDINNVSAQLSWEYWDGLNWLPLFVQDGTNAFTQSGEIKFQLTEQVQPCTINGQTDYWVRCCITSGAYGYKGQTVVTESAAQIFSRVPNNVLCDDGQGDPGIVRAHLIEWFDVNRINFGFKYQDSQYWPPFIQSLLICFEYVKAPSTVLAYNNNGDWTKLTEDRRPYIPATTPTFLSTGFQLTAGQDLKGEAITTLFILKEGCRMLSLAPEFYYWNGTAWKSMTVEWSDCRLVGAIMVGLQIPEDIVPSSLYGSKAMYWISMQSPAAHNPADILAGIYVNVGIAAGYTTIQNRILGSGTGQADFSIMCPDAPVLNLVLEIFESSDSDDEVSSDDRASGIVYSQSLESSVAEAAANSGDENGTEANDGSDGAWIEWKAVDTFAYSGPRDRVYILDALDGTLYFGNGVQGMSVPLGSNNIRARSYLTPLGRSKAVVPVGSLNQLQTSESGIQSVSNPMVANGVVDMQSRPDFLNQAPALLKSRQRAMSAGDFIALAEQASPRVARALLVPDPENAVVNIQILTNVAEDSYVPSADLIAEVTACLQSHAVACAGTRITVSGPRYQPVDLVITGIPLQNYLSASEWTSCENEIRKNVCDYLDPLTGGPNGKGWNPGYPVATYPLNKRLKELSLLEGAEAVDRKGKNRISMDMNLLPAPGDLKIRFLPSATPLKTGNSMARRRVGI
jgi:hypothetical protein